MKTNILKDNIIKINTIDFRGSICDGPGIRTIIYFQGCNRKCNGCHNPQTWDKGSGTEWYVEELVRYIKKNSRTKRVTISGGEPLLQQEALHELIILMRGYDIALYTSFSIQEVPLEIIENINYIKIGEFDKEKQCSTNSYIGSTNQKFIVLKEALLV